MLISVQSVHTVCTQCQNVSRCRKAKMIYKITSVSVREYAKSLSVKTVC